MNQHEASANDLKFIADFEAGRIPAEAFDHRSHVRLAYICLCQAGVDDANARIRQALQRFLAHVGAPPDKYHETLTRAWILAVAHFMNKTPPCVSADELIEHNPQLLDSRIMLTHYSAELLFSDQARAAFVEPDLERIPSDSRANSE